MVILKVAKSLILSVHGRNPLFHSRYWKLSTESDTRNPLQSSGRPSLLVCKTGILSVSLRQVSIPSLRLSATLTPLSGSGKTAAFVIPMLAFISGLPLFTDDNRHLGPYALIMAPTRELAQQIESETKKFAGPLGFTCVSIVGGVRGDLLSDSERILNIISSAFGRGATIQPAFRRGDHHRHSWSVEGRYRTTRHRSFPVSLHRNGRSRQNGQSWLRG